MKLIPSSFFLSSAVVTFICCGCPVKSESTLAIAAEPSAKKESVERYYYVKGMTCGGCIFGVKKALQRVGISKEQILEVDYRSPDPENQVGHAKVKFQVGNYKGAETDCQIAKEIKSNPGYLVYWDKSNTDPCGLEKKTN